jgi:hypothetical protein
MSSVSGISAAGLAQYVLTSSNSKRLQQAFQTLKNSLLAGDLTTADSAFQSVQQLFQNSAAATGYSNYTQFFTDLSALGNAISSGNLVSAQAAFTTVQSDLQTGSSPTLALETGASSQSVQLVQELLGTVSNNSQDSASTTTADQTTSVLDAVYGNRSGLNVVA